MDRITLPFKNSCKNLLLKGKAGRENWRRRECHQSEPRRPGDGVSGRAHATKARARMRGDDSGPLCCWPLLLLLRRPRDNSCPLRVEDVGLGWLWSEGGGGGLFFLQCLLCPDFCSGNVAMTANRQIGRGIQGRSVRPKPEILYQNIWLSCWKLLFYPTIGECFV